MRSGATLTQVNPRGNWGAGIACSGARTRAKLAGVFQRPAAHYDCPIAQRQAGPAKLSARAVFYQAIRAERPCSFLGGESILRKLITGAVIASASLALAAGAFGQSTEGTFTADVSPSRAGTVSHPKNTTLAFGVTLDKPGTTVEFIDLGLPRGLKFSTKGLKRCSVNTLASRGPTGCPSGSKAGPTGTATALLGPAGPTQSELHFNVSPFVLNSTTLVFYVASEAGTGIAVQSPITGKLSDEGRKLRIRIPQELRQPVPGVDASLTSLNQTFVGRVGKNYLVSSIGCKNRKHKFNSKLTFTSRADGAPVPGPVLMATTAPCKKA